MFQTNSITHEQIFTYMYFKMAELYLTK